MTELALLTVSALAICVAVYTGLSLLRKPSGPFHIVTIFIALALVDVYVPTILWVIEGIPTGPEWMTDITYVDMLKGLLFYTVFYILMLTPILLAKENWTTPTVINLKSGRLESGTPIVMLLSIAALLLQIDSYGGFSAWFFRMSVARWTGELDENAATGFVGLMLLIPWRPMFCLLVIMGFYFRYKLIPRYLYTYFYPSMAFLLAMTTFFRGSVLLLTLGLIFAERARRNSIVVIEGRTTSPKKSFNRKRLLIWLSLIASVFVAFGAVRDHFNLEALESSGGPKGISTLLRQGSGILGVAAIVGHYSSKEEEQFGGKTYLDMLLLPIPRSIYPSKPEWYGIDDITRGMGWPRGTQSAVTIPGEAFANFGLAGLLVAPLVGIILKILFKYTSSSGKLYFFLYPGVVLYIIFISNWMSFSGMMNQLLPFVCMFLLILVFLQKRIKSPRRYSVVSTNSIRS